MPVHPSLLQRQRILNAIWAAMAGSVVTYSLAGMVLLRAREFPLVFELLDRLEGSGRAPSRP